MLKNHSFQEDPNLNSEDVNSNSQKNQNSEPADDPFQLKGNYEGNFVILPGSDRSNVNGDVDKLTLIEWFNHFYNRKEPNDVEIFFREKKYYKGTDKFEFLYTTKLNLKEMLEFQKFVIKYRKNGFKDPNEDFSMLRNIFYGNILRRNRYELEDSLNTYLQTNEESYIEEFLSFYQYSVTRYEYFLKQARKKEFENLVFFEKFERRFSNYNFMFVITKIHKDLIQKKQDLNKGFIDKMDFILFIKNSYDQLRQCP